jgi:glycosyltransferase involved in cell wall biosynthesis
MSSDFEGLPIAMLEAMALAKPIVATAVGGIPGVVRDGIEGYTVPARQPAQLAEKMLRLARDKDLRRTLGLQAFARVRDEYDIAVMVRKVENIYREVLAR